MTKNRLVVVGWLGGMRAYLNVPREVAIERYRIEERWFDREIPSVREIEFEDVFQVYDAWEA